MQDQAPGLSLEGQVATITLRRPSQHNRIAPEDSTLISDYLSQVTQSDARVLVITGTGEKTFSSGYTLDALQDHLDSRFEDMLDQVEQLPLPTICALNGSVYGGATDLALCCDMRIGVEGSRLMMPASRMGLHYYPEGIRRYVGMLGLAAAKKLFLTARTIDDHEMLRIGFLNDLVVRDDLAATVQSYIDDILACESKVLATMKMDLAATAYGNADPSVLRSHYQDALVSPELTRRLEARLARKSKVNKN